MASRYCRIQPHAPCSALERTRRSIVAGLLMISSVTVARPMDSSSSQYRLVSGGPANVVSRSTSALYHLQLAGGSGAALGISATTAASLVSGPLSHDLPTARIFRGRFED